jgi:hypothetical protein
MLDLATALARIESRHARLTVAERLSQVIARQRRELAAEAAPIGKP